MADTQTQEREATALVHNNDDDKSIGIVQQKMDTLLRQYLQDFCKKNPGFHKNYPLNRDHILLEGEKHWQDWNASAQELWKKINEDVHNLPPAGVGSDVMVTIFVAAPGVAPNFLTQQREPAAITGFDTADGLERRYVVPKYENSLPTFDDMKIEAGLMVITQSVSPFFNQRKDNRDLGMGAGADIYGGRTTDKLLGGNEGEDEKFTTPVLGMPFGLGGPPILGVPPMGQSFRPPPPTPREEAELKERQVGGSLTHAAEIAAGLEAVHLLEERTRENNLREEGLRQQALRQQEDQRQQNNLREQEVHAQEVRDNDARAQELNNEGNRQQIVRQELRNHEALNEQERDRAILLELEAQKIRQQEAMAGAVRGGEEAPRVEATRVGSVTSIVELAKDSVIAEAEITSPEKTGESMAMDGPMRPEMANDIAAEETQSALATGGGAELSTARAEVAAAEEDPPAYTLVNNETLVGETLVAKRAKTMDDPGEATLLGKPSAVGELPVSDSERQQIIRADAGSAGAVQQNIETAEAQEEKNNAPNPYEASGASGGAAPLIVEAAASEQQSDQSQTEITPEDIKEKLNTIREQMGDEGEDLMPMQTGQARAEATEAAATDEQVATETTAKSGAAEDAAAENGVVETSEDGRAAETANPYRASGALGNGERALVETAAVEQPSDQSQEVSVDAMKEKYDALREQMGDQGEELAPVRTTATKAEATDATAAGEEMATQGSAVEASERGQAVETDPYRASGASGRAEPVIAETAAVEQPSDQSQNEATPDALKEKYDALREQVGSEGEEFAPVRTSGARTEGAETTVADEQIAAQGTAPTETMESGAGERNVVETSEHGQVADPHRASGASGNAESAIAETVATEQSSDQSQNEVTPDAMKEKYDALREQVGDQSEEFAPGRTSESRPESVEPTAATERAAPEDRETSFDEERPIETNEHGREEFGAERGREVQPEPVEKAHPEAIAGGEEPQSQNETALPGGDMAHHIAEHFLHGTQHHGGGHEFAAAPVQTYIPMHTLGTVEDAAVLGAMAKGAKRVSSRKKAVAAADLRTRKGRAQEWKAQRRKIKAAVVKAPDKQKVLRKPRLNPEKLPSLKPDE